MKNYRQMAQTLNSCLRVNMWKALFSFLMMSVLESLFMTSFSFFAMLIISSRENSIAVFVISLIFLFVGFVFVMILQYGYQVLLLRMLRNEYVTLGFLFNGFRERKRIAKASALYSLGFILAFIFCQIVVLVLKIRNPDFFTGLSLPELAGRIFAIYMIFVLVLLVPFSFVWVCLADNPNEKVLRCFKKSFVLMKGRCFRFCGFVIYAGGFWLAAAAVIYALSLFLPKNLSGAASFLASIFEFAYFIAAYTAFVRMCMAVPLFYLNVTGSLVEIENAGKLPAPADCLPEPISSEVPADAENIEKIATSAETAASAEDADSAENGSEGD